MRYSCGSVQDFLMPKLSQAGKSVMQTIFYHDGLINGLTTDLPLVAIYIPSRNVFAKPRSVILTVLFGPIKILTALRSPCTTFLMAM